MKNYLDLLPNDILENIKMMVAVNPPPHLNLYEVLYFQYINKMNTKELIQFCRENNINYKIIEKIDETYTELVLDRTEENTKNYLKLSSRFQ